MIIRCTLLLLVVAAAAVTVRAAPTNGNFELIILHNNDMHARFEQTGAYGNDCQPADVASNRCYGGFARVAHKVREYRSQEAAGGLPVLYLNAGDTYTGTPWFAVYKDNITAAFLNILKPDAISLGNHEFDNGVDGLVPFLNEVDFPVLTANLDLSQTPSMAEAKSLLPSTVFTKDGVKIGVIGYLTPETKQLTTPSTVDFTDEIVAINKEAAVLKAQGVKILIALGHSGLERDREIAASCPDIDIVIGGHSHTFLYSGAVPDIDPSEGPYPVMVKNKEGRDVPVVQAYAYTKYLGYMKVEFDADGKLVSFDGKPILLNGAVDRDADVLKLLDVYRPGILELDEVIGQTRVLLDATRCRFEECNIGNMIADSMVMTYTMSRDDPESQFWTDAAIAFVQGGGIRASIEFGEDGNITKKDLKTVLPFGNAIILAEVTGETIMKMLERSVYRYDGRNGYGEFLQMAGVHVVYDLSKPPGHRVASAEVRCARCTTPSYGPLYDYDRYKIIISQFLWEGGDGYDMFSGRNFQVLDFGEYEMTEEYLKRFSPVYPAIEWRVTLNGEVNPEHMTTTTDTPSTTTEDNGGAAGDLKATTMTVVALAFVCMLQRLFM